MFSKPFLAFMCFKSCKNGDMVKIDLNVLYIKCLLVVTMESDHSLIVFGNKYVFLSSSRNAEIDREGSERERGGEGGLGGVLWVYKILGGNSSVVREPDS